MIDRFADEDERLELFNCAKQAANKNFNVDFEDLNPIPINFCPVMFNQPEAPDAQVLAIEADKLKF